MSSADSACLLHGNGTRANALEDLLLATPATLLASGQPVFWEGDPAHSVVLVTSGMLRLSRFLVDGRRGVIRFVFDGEFLGLSTHDKYHCAAEAISNARIHRFPRERLYELSERSPELRRALFGTVSDEILAAQEQLLMLGQKNAEERVASLLLMIARRTGTRLVEGARIHLPMNRADVADYLGLTVETVCRIMTKLKKMRYVATIGRSVVVLSRPAELMLFAGGCEDSVKSPSRTAFVASPVQKPLGAMMIEANSLVRRPLVIP